MRLWPVSRESHPKPFIKMADGESGLLKTLQRPPPPRHHPRRVR
jgi:mannose-1-phosphate guanylyltransferase